jgi:hypothetical protein
MPKRKRERLETFVLMMHVMFGVNLTVLHGSKIMFSYFNTVEILLLKRQNIFSSKKQLFECKLELSMFMLHYSMSYKIHYIMIYSMLLVLKKILQYIKFHLNLIQCLMYEIDSMLLFENSDNFKELFFIHSLINFFI